MGADDKAGQGAEGDIDPGRDGEAARDKAGEKEAKEEEGGGMVTRKAGDGFIFNVGPRDFFGDADAGRDDKGGAFTRDEVVVAQEVTVDEENDAGGNDDTENKLGCFSPALPFGG